MKKLISIVVVALFLVHFAGFYAYFALRLNQIHQEMRGKIKMLPTYRLEKFSLPAITFRQSIREDGEEIEISGRMYDVARIENSGDRVTVFALHDSAEDSLLSFLGELLKTGTKDSQQAPSSLYQFSLLSYILPDVFFIRNANFSQADAFTHYFLNDLSFIPSLDTPPPRG